MTTLASTLAIVNARLLDPASDYDGLGSVLIEDGRIVRVIHGAAPDLAADQIIDADGLCLSPGLIDIRVKTGEPGAEPRETLKSASLAAAAGGVTTIVVQPDTDPAIDDPAVIEFIQRRGAALNLVNVRAAGAATKALDGQRMAEIAYITAPTTSDNAASASPRSKPWPSGEWCSNHATIGGPAIWPTPYSTLTNAAKLSADEGHSRRASCSPKKVITVNGSPSNTLPSAKPTVVGSSRPSAMPAACTR